MTASLSSPCIAFWFRRDLRFYDNHGLYRALIDGRPVLPIFIFDEDILTRLADRDDARVSFLHRTITKMDEELRRRGSRLVVRFGKPVEVWTRLISEYPIAAVFANSDYEPYPRRRDSAVAELLKSRGVKFASFKDQVVFERAEVVKDDGKPYSVFTPYSRKWKSLLKAGSFDPYPSEQKGGSWAHREQFAVLDGERLPSLEALNFRPTTITLPEPDLSVELMRAYEARRNFPAVPGTSRVGLHLRFGTVSVRELARRARAESETWLNELIWREFFMMILWHYPHTVNRAFRPEYDAISWRESEADFAAWCEGRTGYPLVDAGMRELNSTGYMHNRVRMVVASFLCKHLLIGWQKGERYFARKLLDYELASNVGNWQWAAGTGCDAAPYFRVFNPDAQAAKFDRGGEYIRKWVPEWRTSRYPQPIVEHKLARVRALRVYKEGLAKAAVAP